MGERGANNHFQTIKITEELELLNIYKNKESFKYIINTINKLNLLINFKRII